MDTTYVEMAAGYSVSGYDYAWSFPDGSTSTSRLANTIFVQPDYDFPGGDMTSIIRVPYILTVTGGGCSLHDTNYVNLPHRGFNCSNYSAGVTLYGETSGTANFWWNDGNMEVCSGMYVATLHADFGDGTPGVFSLDTLCALCGDYGSNFNHTYNYSGEYIAKFSIVLTNMLDSEHQTCILPIGNVLTDAPSFGSDYGISSMDFNIATPTPTPINIPSEVTVCEGDTLRIVASDTMHMPGGYFCHFYHVDTAYFPEDYAAAYSTVTTAWTTPDDTTASWGGSDTSIVLANTNLIDSGIYTLTITYPGDYTAPATYNYPVHVTVLPNSVSSISGAATICSGATTTLIDSVSGGVWSSSGTATVSSGGVVTGVGGGAAVISYTISNACGTHTATTAITVNTAPVVAPITGTTAICVGGSTTLSDTTSGGTWSSTSTSVSVTGGVVTTSTAGTATISYSVTNDCGTTPATTLYTVYALPSVSATSAHVGFCTGGSDTLNATGGLTYSWSPSTGLSCAACAGPVATTAGTYVVTGVDVNGCSDTGMVTIVENTPPTVTASVSTGCSPSQTLTASGATSYSWSPTTGLACATCAATTATITTPITYTVTGTDVNGCTDTATATPAVNRIMGHITFSGTTPDTTDVKVWLIQYNPSDSSLTALDSTTTCLDGTTPFFEFDGIPAGNYMVKGKLIYGDAPGMSGYIPTYSSSTPYWYDAATAAHTSGTDDLPITMIYGTVPSGPGFIGGLIVEGAGKNTSTDVPVEGMIVYVRNTATNILTHVYTNASGMYSFSGLAYGTYDIFPTDFDYYTTPSATIDLASGADTMLNVNFKQHTSFGTITPYTGPTKVTTLNKNDVVVVYPNPATSELTIGLKTTTQKIEGKATLRDVWGKEVYTTDVTTTQTKMDLSQLPKGVYMINVQTTTVSYSGKVVVE